MKFLNQIFRKSIFLSRLFSLFKRPVFIFITLWGHLVLFVGSLSFYYFESDVNPKVNSYFDVLHWAIATVTTVGYGEFAPVTLSGKLVSVFMMIFGSIFLWSYTALFTGALVTPELKHLMRDLRTLEKDVEKLEKNVVQKDEKTIQELALEIERLSQELKRKSEVKNPL